MNFIISRQLKVSTKEASKTSRNNQRSTLLHKDYFYKQIKNKRPSTTQTSK